MIDTKHTENMFIGSDDYPFHAFIVLLNQPANTRNDGQVIPGSAVENEINEEETEEDFLY